jgi:DNA-binding IclR family transcriptional regulator
MPYQAKNFSKSASRALDVLGFFSIERRPARACEIGEALGIARSSADQLLKTMVASGHLVLSIEDKTYFPSLRLAKFGSWLASCYPEAGDLLDIVAEVRDRTDAIVTITVENDCFMQMMEFAYERTDLKDDPDTYATINATLQVGVRVPVLRTAVGAAALMTKTKAEVRKLMHRARYRGPSAGGKLEFKRLMEDLARDRSRGYSSRPTHMPVDQREPGYWSIGVPFPVHHDRAAIVLGLTGTKEKVCTNERWLAQIMHESIDRRLSTEAAINSTKCIMGGLVQCYPAIGAQDLPPRDGTARVTDQIQHA